MLFVCTAKLVAIFRDEHVEAEDFAGAVKKMTDSVVEVLDEVDMREILDKIRVECRVKIGEEVNQ